MVCAPSVCHGKQQVLKGTRDSTRRAATAGYRFEKSRQRMLRGSHLRDGVVIALLTATLAVDVPEAVEMV